MDVSTVNERLET